MTRAECAEKVDALLEHLMQHPDVLLEFANGERHLMISDSGQLNCARPGDLTCGWRLLAPAEMLKRVTWAMRAWNNKNVEHPLLQVRAAVQRAERLGYLFCGLADAHGSITDLHWDAMNPGAEP